MAKKNKKNTQYYKVLFPDCKHVTTILDMLDPGVKDHKRVWRQYGFSLTVSYCNTIGLLGGGRPIMAWGGIYLDNRTHLYVIRNGPLSAVRYSDEILHW